MNKFLTGLVLSLVMFLVVPHSDNAQAITYTLKVKSTVNALNVREKPSKTSKVVGELKKNQTVAMRYLDDVKGFYEVIYKGKKAYVSMDYATEVKPNQRWIGDYFNQGYSGSGALTELYVYKKTSNYIYFVSRTGYRYDPTNGELSGYQMPWKYNNYYGSAKLTSSTSASFSSKSCKTTFKSVGNTIRVTEKSKEGSCDSTGLGMYYDSGTYGGAYEKY